MVRQSQQSGLVDKNTRWFELDPQDPEGEKGQQAHVRCLLTSTEMSWLWPHPKTQYHKEMLHK